mgnify:CR=1 FL=1
MMRNIIISVFFLSIAFMSPPSCLSVQQFYYNYQEAGGDWENREIGNRIALMADSHNQTGFIDIVVPEKGGYQLYGSLLHTWDEAWPRIEIRITQRGKNILEGYFSGEPGELSHQKSGRWLYKSVNRGELISLKEGIARVEFKLLARKSIRNIQGKNIEKEVYISDFVLIPGHKKYGYMNILEAERAGGEWDIIEHKEEERCGVLESVGNEQATATIDYYIPQPGIYKLQAFLRNKGVTKLRVRDDGVDTLVSLNQDDHWRNRHLLSRFFESGPGTIALQNIGSSQVMVDSFLMAPFVKKNDNITLSCSTVFFYHNMALDGLENALKNVSKAGFDSVDIVAYDDSFGVDENSSEKRVEKIRSLLKKLNLHVSSIHFGAITLRSDEEALSKIEWAIRLAKKLGSNTIVAPPSLDIDEKNFITREEGKKVLQMVIEKIKPLLERSDITLGLENHSGRKWLFQKSADFLEMRNLLSRNITFIPDEGHFLLAGEDPIIAINRLAPYTSFFHFKTDNPRQLSKQNELFRKEQWNGHISIEVEKAGPALESWNELYKNHLINR